MKKILCIVFGIMLISLCACSSNNVELSNGTYNEYFEGHDLTYNAEYLVDGKDVTLSGGEYETLKSDNTVFLVINGGHLKIKDATIKKTGEPQLKGESTYGMQDASKTGNKMPEPPKDENGNPMEPPKDENGNPMPPPKDENGNPMPPPGEMPFGKDENSFESDLYNFFGLNSAIVCKGKNSSVTIENCTIETDAKSANAVFSMDNAKIDIKDSTIITHKDFSRGLFTTYGGIIESDNVEITTEGSHCPCIATDRGSGTLNVNNNTIISNGKQSSLIYSTGNININNSKGEGKNAEVIVIEGNNSVSLKQCEFTSNDPNSAILCYQSTPGKNKEYIAKLKLDNTIINYTGKGSAIWTTNGIANIESNASELISNSKIVLHASGGNWGNPGDNAGELTLTSSNETYTGNIVTDELSKINITLNKSTIEGEKIGNVEVK